MLRLTVTIVGELHDCGVQRMESLSRTAQGRPSSELASHTETRQGAHGLSEDSIREHPSLALHVAICNFPTAHDYHKCSMSL